MQDSRPRYTTRRDAIEQAIKPVLTEGQFDVDAICHEAFKFVCDSDAQGNELLNTAGFEQVVSDDDFWEIVARNDTSGRR